VGVRAAQQRAVDHPRQLDVVEVVALAADEARVLLALEAAEADRALGGGGLDGRHAQLSRVAAGWWSEIAAGGCSARDAAS
jgi:hypothetical protein